MKYLLLVHHNEEVLGNLSEAELGQMRDESVQLTQQLHVNRQFLDAAPLHSTATATCVRVREGQRFITDGPFAETREQVGGYFFINADSLDEAISIAGQIPGARIGMVEIRQVIELEELTGQSPKRLSEMGEEE